MEIASIALNKKSSPDNQEVISSQFLVGLNCISFKKLPTFTKANALR